jgi:hypothetical protein
LPPTSIRVHRQTAAEINAVIRERTNAQIARLERARPVELRVRLAELDREWDIERLLQANAATLWTLGVVLGHGVDRRFLLLPLGVLTFFMQHALQGWCPPIPVFRRLGVRTTREIQRERYAIKVLRGDFDAVPRRGEADPDTRVRRVLEAIDR